MRDYGKIIGGKLYHAPNILNKDGKQYINPPEEMLFDFNYRPIVYTDIPDIKEGYHIVSSYVEENHTIVQKWNYEKDVLDENADTSFLLEKIKMLEDKVNELMSFAEVLKNEEIEEL